MIVSAWAISFASKHIPLPIGRFSLLYFFRAARFFLLEYFPALIHDSGSDFFGMVRMIEFEQFREDNFTRGVGNNVTNRYDPFAFVVTHFDGAVSIDMEAPEDKDFLCVVGYCFKE